MKNRLLQLKALIPDTSLGKKSSLFIFLIFFILPFQTPILHKACKKLSTSIIPQSLHLPDHFPSKIAFFPSEFLLFTLLLFVAPKRWRAFFLSGPSKYLTLLFATALLSFTLSSTSNYPLMYTRFIELALILVLFNSIRSVFDQNTITPFIRTLSWLIFALSLFECSIALLQFFSQKSLGLKSLGEHVTKSTFDMPNGMRWLFDSQSSRSTLLRASGTFPHPNIFGGFLFFALLNTFYLYITQSKKKLLLAGILIQIPTLLLTFSRSALIAFSFTTLFWLYFQLRDSLTRKSALQLTSVLIALTAFCIILFYPQLTARGGILNYNKLVQGADTERQAYQTIALNMIKEHPFLGIGLNNFQIESPKYSPQGIYPSRVHNIYLLIAAETGLIGVSFFFLFLVSLLKNARQALSTHEGQFLFSIFVGFLFIGACDFYLFCTPHGQILFFGTAAHLHVISMK